MTTMHYAKAAAFATALTALSLSIGCSHSDVAVTTYHYDNLRTGWNADEKKLTDARVSSPDFGLLHSVFLDDQVDAQPLRSTGADAARMQQQQPGGGNQRNAGYRPG